MRMLEWMDLDYIEGDFVALKEYYFEYIENRCKVVKEKFIVALGFSSNPESAKESQDDFAPTEERFTDEFFRLERIGVVARKSIEYLLLSGRLSQKDFENLRDAEYCNSMKNLQ